MLRSERMPQKLDTVFVPEAQRKLAGDEITRTVCQSFRVLKGRQTGVVSGRDVHFALRLRFHRRLISAAPPAQRMRQTFNSILVA